MKSKEAERASDFFNRAKKQLGPVLCVDRISLDYVKGKPDYFVTYSSYSIPMEAKIYLEKSGNILKHDFDDLQMRDMRMRKKSGAFPIGLILESGSVARFILPEDIPENGQVSKSLYLTLEVFSWERILELARQHSRGFER